MGPAIAPSADRRSVAARISRLRTAAGQKNPYPHYAELRAMGDIVPAPWGGHLITSFGLADRVLRSKDWHVPDARWRASQGEATRWSAASSREMSKTLPALNPPDHTRVRRVTSSRLDRRSLEELRRPVADITHGLLDRFAEHLTGGEADFVPLVAEELPVITIGRWLGLPAADHPLLRDLTHDQVFAQELLPSASQLALSDAATAQLRGYFTSLVRERRSSPGPDPVSAWIRAWDEIEPDREAADEAVYHTTLFVLLAALETTSTLLATTVQLLLEHPEQWEWLRGHPEQVPAAVEEALRYDAPTHVASRIARKDLTLAGVDIREDQMVHLMIGAANHDPAHCPDPDTFDIRRKAAHLSFSGGIHYCLGAPLARLEATTLLTALLERFPTLVLAREPRWAPRVAFRRMLTLPVALP
ncbi:cytochrome P450 [Streptomyces sp. CNQ085]|uniref:cytochrome P450 n=1 Tax=Streptomyces sp. CNQ085 TaxID=2886944 RepID=UPI001F512C51|nr:cytochrome P450 [Streptomyces sp. CNQ085]MCI0384157.1 cytochrome P450 [Streptomyces sp. CNQ085]